MGRGAFYNEHDKFAAEWLRRLILFGHIAEGDVDERSIEDVTPDDLEGYDQVHLFAGIGVWSAALRGAGWPDDREVWTISCPCQPFSAAGKSAGFADERHLWPAAFHLLRERGPVTVLGEQVASKDGLAWDDLVQADMEAEGYARGSLDTCAAGVGAPHIRQRLYWAAHRVAHHSAGCGQREERNGEPETGRRVQFGADVDGRGDSVGVAHHHQQRRERGRPGEAGFEPGTIERPERLCAAGGLGDTDGAGPGAHGRDVAEERGFQEAQRQPGHDTPVLGRTGAAGGLVDTAGEQTGLPRCAREPGRPDGFGGVADDDDAGPQGRLPGRQDAGREDQPGRVGCSGPAGDPGYWSDVDWIYCRDDKWRPVEPGTFPLAHGARSRVGRLRAYGNALVRPQAQVFCEVVMEALA